jgi:Rrf2 family transcriptional regulator, cysteine metabolism repressor
MRMTVAGEYGCLALLAIAEGAPEYCKRHRIAERFSIPPAFLAQILLKLVASGFIVSRRGAAGGFRLARNAGEIVVADVMRALDGPLAPTRSVSENFYQATPLEASPGFHALVRRVRDAVASILEQTTLEDVLAEERQQRRKSRR